MCVLFLLQILDLICVVCMMENSNNELAEILISKLRLAIETARHLINHRLDKCQRKYYRSEMIKFEALKTVNPVLSTMFSSLGA